MECKAIQVGSSDRNLKTIEIDHRLQCPIKVDRTNWLNGINVGHTFSLNRTSRNELSVIRIDQVLNWDMNLEFKCCFVDGRFFY